MRFENFVFGSLQIDGNSYKRDVIIDRGELRKRWKKPSKKFRKDFGHTLLSVEENIPGKCDRLVIGTGAYGRLPVMKGVRREAERPKLKRFTNAVAVLLLLTPLLSGQNPDELLVVRLPAKRGQINLPGTAPIPRATVPGEIPRASTATTCGAGAGCSSLWHGDVCRSEGAGECRVGSHDMPPGTRDHKASSCIRIGVNSRLRETRPACFSSASGRSGARQR